MINGTSKKVRQQVIKAVKDESFETVKSVQRQIIPEEERSEPKPLNNVVGKITNGVSELGFDQNAHAQDTAAKLISLRKRLKQIQQEELSKAGQDRHQSEEEWSKSTDEKMHFEENQAKDQSEFIMPAGKPKGKAQGPAAAKQKATKAETGRKKA